jgi:cytochrome c biogenesis protein CcmG/thiol:disulfide interchange protein DsbE
MNRPARRRGLRYLIPAAVFGLVAVFLLLRLQSGRDAREIPSPLLNKPAPGFSLPQLRDPSSAWSPQAMQGQVWLLNVWASWCVPCLAEHPIITQLARDARVPVIGLNYKDEPDNAIGWLERHGDPYAMNVSDRAGRVGFDFGVYGVPETFVIDAQGVIRFKHVGPITPEVLRDRLAPLLKSLGR